MIDQERERKRSAAIAAGVRLSSLNPFNSMWSAPEAEEIHALLSFAGLSGSEVGSLVGVDSRTVRRWIGGNRKISYSAWAILVSVAGLGELWKDL
ncbi:hypothetical protein D3C80_905740 [compost metagenome]